MPAPPKEQYRPFRERRAESGGVARPGHNHRAAQVAQAGAEAVSLVDAREEPVAAADDAQHRRVHLAEPRLHRRRAVA